MKVPALTLCLVTDCCDDSKCSSAGGDGRFVPSEQKTCEAGRCPVEHSHPEDTESVRAADCVVGLRWEDADVEQPRVGTEIINRQLSDWLASKRDISRDELKSFGVSGLTPSSYIKAGGTWLKPDDTRCCRVEVKDPQSKEWGTVCDDRMLDPNNAAARVICKGFQCSGADARALQFGGGNQSDPIWLDDVVCAGEEQGIFDCQHLGVGRHD